MDGTPRSSRMEYRCKNCTGFSSEWLDLTVTPDYWNSTLHYGDCSHLSRGEWYTGQLHLLSAVQKWTDGAFMPSARLHAHGPQSQLGGTLSGHHIRVTAGVMMHIIILVLSGLLGDWNSTHSNYQCTPWTEY